MIFGLIFSVFFGLLSAGVLPPNITVVESNGGLIDPSLIIPKKFLNLTVQEADPGLIDPELLEPKISASNRATSACGCGYSVSNPNPAAGRIVNGQEVNPMHSRPYQVYVQACMGTQCFMCGGTLLNQRYVLTAMHCVKSGSSVASVRVVLGEHNIQQDYEQHTAQSIRVERIIMRDDYNEQSIDNDIAILRMERNVQLDSHIVPACLPTDLSKDYANYDAIVSGWGAVSEGGSTSDVLKETTVKIVPQTDPTCTKYGNPMPNIKMCGYRSNTDSCQGDSGGPLVVKEDGRFTVVGVVSYGAGCAREGYAGVYARVTAYMDWIQANIQDGWCSDESGVVFPTNNPETTAAPATTAAPGAGCDLSCGVGAITGTYYLNDILSDCVLGVCTARDGTDLCELFDYPCGGRPTTAPPATLPPTTTPPPPPTTTATAGAGCDISCATGPITGSYYLNGILSNCVQGVCSANDGTDLCDYFGYPCGGQEPVLRCSNPCNLRAVLRDWMDSYSAGQVDRLKEFIVGWFPPIHAECDLSSGDCCPMDYPDSDLCSRLGRYAEIYG